MFVMFDKKVKEMRLGGNFSDLIDQMHESGGFSGKNLGKAVYILEDMIKEKDCIKFLSFPACIVATGLRGAIAQTAAMRTASSA